MLALKLDKAEKNFKVSVDQHGAKDSGVFGLIPMSTFELYHSSALTEPYKIKEIKLSTLESPIATEIYNDSIKSYYSAFKEFSLKINDNGDLQLHSSNDGLITNHNSAEWLFYTINETVYLFMMQRSDLKDIKKGTLYRYLFPNQQLVTKSM